MSNVITTRLANYNSKRLLNKIEDQLRHRGIYRATHEEEQFCSKVSHRHMHYFTEVDMGEHAPYFIGTSVHWANHLVHVIIVRADAYGQPPTHMTIYRATRKIVMATIDDFVDQFVVKRMDEDFEGSPE